MIKSNVILY